MTRERPDPRLIVALDVDSLESMQALAAQLDPSLCRVKVGKELFTRCGPRALETLARDGFEVFLDLKFHDIPNTVARACAAAADLGVWMINVHALGGARMLEAAVATLAPRASRPLLVAVTILTSLSDQDVAQLGLPGTAAQNVVRLAGLADDCGLDGVVCSPLEISLVHEATRPGFRLVTPGIRPAGAGADDQRRTLTPAAAIRAGADYLVIGRPITAADDPARQLLTIASSLDDSDA
ncbi:MAG: orotidine-5'-phosphate decarboxylase [Chromatiales bacterium]|nr:orotidine-5'-phosphate decarboxylase [Chromatiales bacterium]